MTQNRLLSEDPEFLQRAGATFRWMLNDLKRGGQTGAEDLGIDMRLLEKIVTGKKPIPPDLLQKAVQIWPVNERDFAPIHDDLPQGVNIMSCAESRNSSRVLSRGGHPYYEYRDTAMTRLAPLRPEFIKLLRVVDDTNPENPLVIWNHGHFLYQLTFFVGDCNYYYEWNGRKYCVAMTTGDSVFGLPFVKHTFTSRNPNALGHILALTFSGLLGGDSRQELAALGARVAKKIATQARTQGALLALHIANGAYSVDFLAAESGVSCQSIERAIHDLESLSLTDLQALAEAMRIPMRELLVPVLDVSHGIMLVRGKSARSWDFPMGSKPCYRFTELAGSCITPHMKAMVLEILGNEVPKNSIATNLYQYGYNYSSVAVTLVWLEGCKQHRAVLEPEDSFIMKPHVPHWFARLESSIEAPRVLLLRTGGRMVGDSAIEASMIGPQLIQRVIGEMGCWYDEE